MTATPLKCPDCGKSLVHAGRALGLLTVCQACGHVFRPRVAPPAPDLLEVPAHPPAPPSPARWILLSAVTCAAALAVAVAITPPRPARDGAPVAATAAGGWEREHHAALVDAKRRAESLAAGGDARGAYQKYQEIERLVAGRAIEDPAVRAVVDGARADRDRLVNGALAGVRPGEPPAEEEWPRTLVVPVTRPAAEGMNGHGDGANGHEVGVALPATRAVAVVPPDPPPVENPPPQVPPPATAPAGQERPPVVAVAAGALAVRPPVKFADEDLDASVGRSIQHGVDLLVSQFDGGKLRVAKGKTGTYPNGLNALCVYALLQAHQAVSDPRLDPQGEFVRSMLAGLKEAQIQGGPETYARAIRLTALALVNRPVDRDAIRQDFNWLLRNHTNGAYGYSTVTPGAWDNSNAQYGLLGVWSGAEVGMEVPSIYWRAVDRHWTTCQVDSGEWAYMRGGIGGGSLSMSLAGLASLFVTQDWLHAPEAGAAVGRPPLSKSLEKGLAWLEQGDRAISLQNEGWGNGYSLYALERVALASGFKYFGKHDWYRALARQAVANQADDGSWPATISFWRGERGDRGGRGGFMRRRGEGREGSVSESDLIETAYHLLFLARGRHPILVNKVRFEGAWSNRPRDAANLARFATRETERPLNWQVVSIAREWNDWADSPVLYLASHTAPNLTAADVGKLRQYVEAGGVLFTHADAGSEAFNRFADELAERLFPGRKFEDLPDGHELYSVSYPMTTRPRLKAVSNGVRLLMVHSPTDVAAHWQIRADRSQKASFQLGVNLFLYASGKSDLRTRLTSAYVPALTEAPTGQAVVARLRYDGNWDPEPYAFERFGRWMQAQTGVAVATVTIDAGALTPAAAPIAHLTGTSAVTLSAAEQRALAAYVQAGGVLVIDAAGGNNAFAQGVQSTLSVMLPADVQGVIPAQAHPAFVAATAPGMVDVGRLRLRPYAVQKLGQGAAKVTLYRHGKGCIVQSTPDLTAGLLGAQTYGIIGFDPATAQALWRNLILWTAAGARQE